MSTQQHFQSLRIKKQQRVLEMQNKSCIINDTQMSQQVFQNEQFFLILVINLILGTVRLSIFNIIFLLTFITSCLKFYKTYLMEKHVDQIQITTFKQEQKNTSIFIHYLAKFINLVLTQKDLLKNIVLCIFVAITYLIFRFVALNWIIMGIINLQYLYTLRSRWSKIKQYQRKKKNLQNSLHEKQIKNTNKYLGKQNLQQMDLNQGEFIISKSNQSIQSSNLISQKDMAMSMIQEVQESQKLQLDDEMPEQSVGKIQMIGKEKTPNSLEEKLLVRKNKRYPNLIQFKQSLIEINEDDFLNSQNENQISQKSNLQPQQTKKKN